MADETKKPARPENPEWRARETRRFAENYYRKVPWHDQMFIPMNEAAKDHFVHVSRSDPRMVAYTPNEQYGKLDRQLTLKPGKYLAKYYGAFLDQNTINGFTGMFRGADAKICFASTADQFEEVYTRSRNDGGGAHACMSYTRPQYKCGIYTHPTRIYAAGDIQLAYIEASPGGAILARALCWPEKKIYTRTYGDRGLLSYALECQGYRSGLLEGARLTPKIHPGYEGKALHQIALAGPYVDHMNWAKYDGTNLIVTNRATGATHSVRHSDGIIYPIVSAPERAGVAGNSNVQAAHAAELAAEAATEQRDVPPIPTPNDSPIGIIPAPRPFPRLRDLEQAILEQAILERPRGWGRSPVVEAAVQAATLDREATARFLAGPVRVQVHPQMIVDDRQAQAYGYVVNFGDPDGPQIVGEE